jgi:hypothetical protein
LCASSASPLVDEAALRDDILQAPRHPRFGRLAVASGTAGFLVVAFDRSRQIHVRDEAHVGLVDAHAESERRDHDDAVLAQESFLVLAPRRVVHATVVRQGGEAGLSERLGGFLDLLARAAVDDPRLALVLAEEVQQLAARVGFLADAIADVGAIEAGDENPRGTKVEPGEDFLTCCGVGGGGERDARDVGKAFVQRRQAEVFRTEVVPPLRHAVRFVDGEQGDAGLVEQALETWCQQAFRGNV